MQRHRPELPGAARGPILCPMTKPAAVSLLAWDRLLCAGARATRAARRALRDAGQPPLEWYDILASLDRRGAMRPRDLQALLGIEQYNLSRVVARMVAAGLIETFPAPADGRGQIIALTAAGKTQRAAMWPAYARAIGAVIEPQLEPDERIQLAGLLQRVG